MLKFMIIMILIQYVKVREAEDMMCLLISNNLSIMRKFIFMFVIQCVLKYLYHTFYIGLLSVSKSIDGTCLARCYI